MNRFARSGTLVFLLVIVGWGQISLAHADDVIAVLSSESPAYQEALAGFQEGYGRPVPIFTLSKEDIPSKVSAKVIVAFGSKAAAHPYPQSAALIYCLSPSVFVGPEQHSGPRIRVYVAPRPEVLLSRLKEIQPNLKRLAVFDILSSPPAVNYFRELQRLARTKNIEVRLEYLTRVEELPDRLRSLTGKMDAVWLPPDPLLITPGAFAIVREFSHSNNVPLYVPIDSLVDKGATACIGSSFREMGRTAGRLAAKAVAGNLESVEAVYPDQTDLTLNLTAAAQSGLAISPEVVRKADRVVSPSEERR